MDMMAGKTQWKTKVVMVWNGIVEDVAYTYDDMEYDGALMMMS